MAVQGSSGPVEADHSAALQGWSGNRTTRVPSDFAGCSCDTKECSGICTGGDPDTDSEHSKEEQSHQSIAKEDQIPVVACKA